MLDTWRTEPVRNGPRFCDDSHPAGVSASRSTHSEHTKDATIEFRSTLRDDTNARAFRPARDPGPRGVVEMWCVLEPRGRGCAPTVGDASSGRGATGRARCCECHDHRSHREACPSWSAGVPSRAPAGCSVGSVGTRTTATSRANPVDPLTGTRLGSGDMSPPHRSQEPDTLPRFRRAHHSPCTGCTRHPRTVTLRRSRLLRG
jgi:hypothetical protein